MRRGDSPFKESEFPKSVFHVLARRVSLVPLPFKLLPHKLLMLRTSSAWKECFQSRIRSFETINVEESSRNWYFLSNRRERKIGKILNSSALINLPRMSNKNEFPTLSSNYRHTDIYLTSGTAISEKDCSLVSRLVQFSSTKITSLNFVDTNDSLIGVISNTKHENGQATFKSIKAKYKGNG